MVKMPHNMTLMHWSVSGWRRVSAALVVVASLTGCEALLNPTTAVTLAITHHGTRTEDGVLPDYGVPDAARIFVNDQGWEISLSEAVIVMTAAQIESCAGETFDFALPYGPFPEHQLALDQDTVDFANVELPEGSYCTLRVEYGRYQAALAEQAFDTPFSVEGTAPVEGRTVYLSGTATRADGTSKIMSFEFVTADTSIVTLDISGLQDGGPFQITTREPGGKTLTVGKTYDAFFRGLDLDNYDPEAVSAGLLDVLAGETYVRSGASVF